LATGPTCLRSFSGSMLRASQTRSPQTPNPNKPNPNKRTKSKQTPATFFFFFFTLVTGPRRSMSLKMSDTRVCEPQIRAHLGTGCRSPRLLITPPPTQTVVCAGCFASLSPPLSQTPNASSPPVYEPQTRNTKRSNTKHQTSL